jgi:hypothetical protein
MKKIAGFVPFLLILYFSWITFIQDAKAAERPNPFSCIGEANALGSELTADDLYKEIEKRIASLDHSNANSLCIIAELMKRSGNYHAEEYYTKSIKADETEPAYELFYADYLRNFRGAQHPLFSEAEEHYYAAWKKLKQIENENDQRPWEKDTKERVERGLIALYQEDGLTLFHWNSNNIDSNKFLKRPFVFFSTINQYAKSTTDFDEVDDARNFTSEALFAASEQRLNRNLTDNELRGIIRAKEQFETLNRLRYRYKQWPALDIFYKYRDIESAQITNFFEPNKFNDVSLNEYGIAVEKPFNFFPGFDLFLKGIYKRIKREGIIEFLKDNKEDVDHYEVKAVISRFIGTNKANLDITYVYQNIKPDVSNPPDRDRQIIAATITFIRPLYELHFETRGLEVFGGVVYDKDSFDDVDIKKNDYFIGASLRGLKISDNLNTFDLTIQPAIFTSKVDNDESQDNSQYRTNFTLLYRFIDEEITPWMPLDKLMGVYPAFLHLVIPFRHDVAIDGPKDFENFKIGIELASKFFLNESFNTKFMGATFLASARYDYQQYYKLDKDVDIFSFNLSMGF